MIAYQDNPSFVKSIYSHLSIGLIGSSLGYVSTAGRFGQNVIHPCYVLYVIKGLMLLLRIPTSHYARSITVNNRNNIIIFSRMMVSYYHEQRAVFPASRHLYPLENYTIPEFQPQPYMVPGEVQAVHDFPRFGHPNDFDDVIAYFGSDAASESAKNYAMGIFGGAILILSIAMLWFFILSVLKISGQQRVGFLAGRLVRPPHATAPIESGVEVVMENEDEHYHAPIHGSIDPTQKSFTRKVFIVRTVFVVFGIFTIVAGILFYTKGVAEFRNSLYQVHQGIDLVQSTASLAINVTDNVIQAKDELESEIQPTRDKVDAGEPICRTDDELSAQIREVWNTLVTEIDSLKSLVEDTLSDFSRDLRTLIGLTEDIESSLTSADIVFYILIAISIFLIAFISVMLTAVVFASMGVSNCFTRCITNAVIWPIFTLLLILAWILSTVFLITSLAGADFCVAPDEYVIDMIEKYKDEFQSAIFAFVLYYVSGCSVKPAGEEEIKAIINTVRLIIGSAHDFSELLGTVSADTIAQLCGVETSEAQTLQKIANFTHAVSHSLHRSMNGVLDILSCHSFNPIYTTFVHDALCSSGVQGLVWIFFTTLTIAICSMMMITFRAALYPVQDFVAPGEIAKGEDQVHVIKYEHNDLSASNVDNSDALADADPSAPDETKLKSDDRLEYRSTTPHEHLEVDKAVQIY